MRDQVIYYAIMGDRDSAEQPAGVLRRVCSASGLMRDEAFTQSLAWEPSPLLINAEHGHPENGFIEISEDAANRFVARIRAAVTGSHDG